MRKVGYTMNYAISVTSYTNDAKTATMLNTTVSAQELSVRKLTHASAIVYKHLDKVVGKTSQEIYYLVLNDWGSIHIESVRRILKEFRRDGLTEKRPDPLDTKVVLYYKLTPTPDKPDQSSE